MISHKQLSRLAAQRASSRAGLRGPRVGWLLGALIMVLSAGARADYVLGVGVSGDSDSGLAEAAFASVGLTEKTSVTGIVAHSSIDIPRRQGLDAWNADLSVDHHFDPVGVEAGVAYWGDSEVLDSTDVRGSLYWRKDGFRIAANAVRRDFTFVIPASDFFAGRDVDFDADGLGLSINFDLTENVDLSLSGMDFDYSINLDLSDRLAFLQLISASRLSLINSLVDFRASGTIGVDVGDHRFALDLATWRGEVDGVDTRSATVRWLAPIGSQADIEFGLGYDDSELYGDTTVLSLTLFFYGN